MDITKYIARQIEFQFPEIYREEGPLLVELVKSYYEFLETTSNQSTYNNRRMFDYQDLDSTLDSMLVFFKNKFLNELPFNITDTRFIVKHILDFYRRKGSKEGLELFFKLFYDSNIDIYYPSSDIIKPSSSKWVVGRYIELYPVDFNTLSTLRDTTIYGNISFATAVVDKVSFIILNSTMIPIISISNIKGQFIQNDIISNGTIKYGKVRGSLNTVLISKSNLVQGLANNHIGDFLDITSSTGYGAKGRVSSVSDNISTDIVFSIDDGGYGYTVSNNNIVVSNQTLFLNNTNQNFKLLEHISQSNTGAFGSIIGQNSISIGVKVSSSNSFSVSSNIFTIDRDINPSFPLLFVTVRNDSASADIGSITNSETVSLITDTISDFLEVRFNANNYSAAPALIPMTGIAPINSNTAISAAFVPRDFTIGTISSLTNINPGSAYANDIFIYAKDPTISRYNKTNLSITFDPLSSYNISIGDNIVQHNPSGNTTNLSIRGKVINKTDNMLDVMLLSFAAFTTSYNIFVEHSTSPISILNVENNSDIPIMGFNAAISGLVESQKGKISKVDIFDSGIGFLDKDKIFMINRSKIIEYTDLMNRAVDPVVKQTYLNLVNYYTITDVVSGIGSSKYQGITEGRWDSKVSHLNSNKYIQDSNFYQDFSYRVDSDLNPTLYTETLKKLAHVSGTKLFYKFYLENDINNKINVKSEMKIT